MKKQTDLLAIIFLLLTTLIFSACGGGGGSSSQQLAPDQGEDQVETVVPEIETRGQISFSELDVNHTSNIEVAFSLSKDGELGGLLKDGMDTLIPIDELDRIEVYSSQIGWPGSLRMLEASANFSDRHVDLQKEGTFLINIPNVSYEDAVSFAVWDIYGNTYFLNRDKWDFSAPEGVEVFLNDDGSVQYGNPQKAKIEIIKVNDVYADIVISMPANIISGFVLDGASLYNMNFENLISFQWSSRPLWDLYPWAQHPTNVFPLPLGTGHAQWNAEKKAYMVLIQDVPLGDDGMISGFVQDGNEIKQIWLNFDYDWDKPEWISFTGNPGDEFISYDVPAPSL